MLDIGWTELLMIGVVALIVIGPKDLPGALRTFGRYVSRARAMVREFQDGLDDIARQEELRELQQNVRDVTRPGSVGKYIEERLDEDGSLRKAASAEYSVPDEPVAVPPKPQIAKQASDTQARAAPAGTVVAEASATDGNSAPKKTAASVATATVSVDKSGTAP